MTLVLLVWSGPAKLGGFFTGKQAVSEVLSYQAGIVVMDMIDTHIRARVHCQLAGVIEGAMHVLRLDDGMTKVLFRRGVVHDKGQPEAVLRGRYLRIVHNVAEPGGDNGSQGRFHAVGAATPGGIPMLDLCGPALAAFEDVNGVFFNERATDGWIERRRVVKTFRCADRRSYISDQATVVVANGIDVFGSGHPEIQMAAGQVIDVDSRHADERG